VPEAFISIFAWSVIFHLTTNSGMYIMPEGCNIDAARHRDVDSYIWAREFDKPKKKSVRI
jgi:hypothetical protein